MTRVVVPGCLGFLVFAACNTPQPAPTPRAPQAHAQAVVQEAAPSPSPAAAAAPGCCGDAACGTESEPSTSCGGQAHSGAEQAQQGQPDRAPATDSADLALLTRITDPSQVCMVRNHFMGRPQLAVAVESGTYFGCCAGCASRLLADPSARVAIDPVSHHPVDKALAVLGRTPRGSVLYFENELTFSAFSAGLN